MAQVISKIGRKGEEISLLKRIARAPIAPPFFLVGILAGFIGTTYHGVHLWMQLSGQMTLGEDFVFLRKAHSAGQLLLFFGAFVSGFLLQAMPKLVETSRLRPLGAILLLPVFVVGAVLIFSKPFSPVGYWLIAFHFLVVTILALWFAALAPRHALYRSGLPIAWATAWLSAGALMDLSYPISGLLIFWGTFIPLIEVTIRRVFFGLIGIDSEKNRISADLASLYLGAAICGAVFLAVQLTLFWWLFAILTSLTVILYATRRLSKNAFKLGPFPFAFWAGMVWLFVGSLLLFKGPESADAALHTWATGLALPLVLVVAPQVIRGHMGIQVFTTRAHLILLILWQLVPLARGPGRIFPFPGWTSTVIGALTALVLLIWSFAMCAALIRGWMKRKT